MRNIVILEDNEVMRLYLFQLIDELHKNVNIYCVDNLKDAYNIAMEHQIHLFLVDIILNPANPSDVSGLRFVQEIRGVKRYEFIPIIFITALQDPELYAYRQLKCLQFIEKPFDEKEVQNAVIKALNFPIVTDRDRFVCFRKDGITHSVCVETIYYIDISRGKIVIHCKDKDLEVAYKSSKQILEELGSISFVQCSRFQIINKRYVEYIDYTNGYVKLQNIECALNIGPVIKKRFKKEMDEWFS